MSQRAESKYKLHPNGDTPSPWQVKLAFVVLQYPCQQAKGNGFYCVLGRGHWCFILFATYSNSISYYLVICLNWKIILWMRNKAQDTWNHVFLFPQLFLSTVLWCCSEIQTIELWFKIMLIIWSTGFPEADCGELFQKKTKVVIGGNRLKIPC